MRTLFLLIALFGLAAPAAAAERRYAIADFDRVIVEGPYTVRLAVGRPTSAVASGSPQALDAVSVEVQGMTLRIRRNRNAWTASPGQTVEPATIVLTTRSLRAARVIGSGSLEIAGARGLRVDLAIEGSGRLSASGLDADAVSVGLRGSGSMELAGRAGMVTADVQGTASLHGAALAADATTVAATTSGEVRLNARRTATVTAAGLGSVTIAGDAACTVRGDGAAEVRCGRAR